MEAYLKSLLVLEAVELEFEIELPQNPTLNRIKLYEEKVKNFRRNF